MLALGLILSLAEPYDFLDRDLQTVREAGYRSFATTLRDPMHPGDSPMWIQRQGLHPFNASESAGSSGG